MSRERRENLPRNQGQAGADGEGREELGGVIDTAARLS